MASGSTLTDSAGNAAAPAVDAAVGHDIALLTYAFGGGAGPDMSVLTDLATAARAFRLPAGPLKLASPRRPVAAWWLVRRGVMSVGAPSARGRFVERHRIGPGDWYDVAGALSTPGTWLCPAVCRTAVELLAVPVDALTRACAADAAFALAFGRVLAEQTRSLHRQLHEMCTADVSARVARWLLQLARECGGDRAGDSWRMTERKRDVAQHLNTTPETLSRTLKQLCARGAIRMQGYEFTLLDPAALRAMGGVQERRS